MTKIDRLTPKRLEKALDEVDRRNIQDLKQRISGKPRQEFLRDVQEAVRAEGTTPSRVSQVKLKALVADELLRIQKQTQTGGKVDLQKVGKHFGSFAASLLEKLSDALAAPAVTASPAVSGSDVDQLTDALDRIPIGAARGDLFALLEKENPDLLDRLAARSAKRVGEVVRDELGIDNWRVAQQTRLATLLAATAESMPGATLREVYDAATQDHAVAFPYASVRNMPARWKADPKGYPEIAELLDADGTFAWERAAATAASGAVGSGDAASPAAAWAGWYKQSRAVPKVPKGEVVDTFDDAQVKAVHELYWSLPPGAPLGDMVKAAAEHPAFADRTRPIKDKQLGRLFADMEKSFPWGWRSRNLAFCSFMVIEGLVHEPKGTSLAKIVDALQTRYPGFSGRSAFTQAAGSRGAWGDEPDRFPFAKQLEKRKDGTYVLESMGEVVGAQRTRGGKLKLDENLAKIVKELALSDDVRFDWELEDLTKFLRGKIGDEWTDSTFRNLRDRYGKIVPDFHAIRAHAKRRLAELVTELAGPPRNIKSAAEMSKVLHDEYGFPEYDQVRYGDLRKDFDFVPKFRDLRYDDTREKARELLDAILDDPDSGRWEIADRLGHDRTTARTLLKNIHELWPDALPNDSAARVPYTAADRAAMKDAVEDARYGASMADVYAVLKTEHPEFFERHALKSPGSLYVVLCRELKIDGWQPYQRERAEKLIANVMEKSPEGFDLLSLHGFLQVEHDFDYSYSTLLIWQREWKKEPRRFPHIARLAVNRKDPDTGKMRKVFPWEHGKISLTQGLAERVTTEIENNPDTSLPDIVAKLHKDKTFHANYPTFKLQHIHALRERFDFVPLINDLKIRGTDARTKAFRKELDALAKRARKVANGIADKGGLTAAHLTRLLSKKGGKVAEHRVRMAILRHLDWFPWYRGGKGGSVDITMAHRVALEMERAPVGAELYDIVETLRADPDFVGEYPSFCYETIQTLRDRYPELIPMWFDRNAIMRGRMVVDAVLSARKGTKIETILGKLDDEHPGVFAGLTPYYLAAQWDADPERFPFAKALRKRGKIDFTGRGTPDAVDPTPPSEVAQEYARLSQIPKSYPVLESMAKGHGKGTFDKYEFVCVQHMLGGQVPFFDVCRKMGMNPNRTSMIGIPYSTSQTVVQALRDKGWEVRDPPLDIEAWTEDVRAALYDRVRSALKHGRKIRVLDDGGLVSKLLDDDPYLKEHADLFVLVEQTRRGITVADSHDLQCPLVNAAQSLAKVLEGLLIGDNLEVKLIKRLEKMGIKSIKGMKIGIDAHGAISAPLAHALKDLGAKVSVRDTDPDAQQAAVDAGFGDGSDAKKFFRGQDLILGAAGVQSVTAEDIPYLKDGTILGSCSSKLVELPIEELTALCSKRGGKIEQLDDGNFPPTIQFTLPDGRRIKVLASGFPLNFDGDVNNLDPWKVQLTHAIMLSGLMQSVGAKVAGVHRLDPSRQLEFLDEYAKVLGDDDQDQELKRGISAIQLRLQEAEKDPAAYYARHDGRMRRNLRT